MTNNAHSPHGSDASGTAKPPGRFAAKLAFSYATVVGACVLFSERLLAALATDPEQLAAWGVALRLACVAVTAPLLYWLVRRRESRVAATEAALRGSEQRLARMAALSSDWYWETDPEMRLSLVIGTSAHGAALDSRGILGKRYSELPRLGLVSMPQAEFEALRASRTAYRDVRFKSLVADNPVYYSVSGEPLLDESGRFCGYRGVTRDVTDEVSMLERLRMSEANFRAVAEHPDIAKALVSRDGNPVFVNMTCCRLLGYSKEDLLASDMRSFTHPDDVAALLSRFEDCRLGNRDSHRMQLRFTRKDGAIVWVELDVSAVRDANGGLLHFVVQAQDIGARRAADDVLRDTQQRLHAMFELAAMGISEVALDSRFLRVNPALCRITGYSSDEMLGLSARDITPPEDLHLSMDRMAGAIAGRGDRFTVEKRYVRKDGRTVWVELTSVLARDAAGMPAYFVSLTQDISQRREAEQALRNSEARYRSVIDHMSAGLVQHSADGRVVACNARALELLGIGRERMFEEMPTDWNWLAAVDEGSTAKPAEYPGLRVLRNGGPLESEIVGLQRPDGSRIWLQISAAPIPGASVDVREAVVTFADITKEREALRALRLSESRYRSVIEAMSEAILLLDAQGRTIGSNPAAAKIYGIDAEQARHAGPLNPVLRFFHDDGSVMPDEERPSYRVLKGGESAASGTYRAIRPDGRSITLLINARRLPLDPGEAPGVLVTLADITAQVDAERALVTLTDTLERRVAERTAELSQVNRELESFSYSVSHDLRAPLRAISGFASLLREDERDRLTGEGAELLDRIAANAQRMGELIDDVLEYSRVTRINRKRESVDVDAILQDVLAPLVQAHPGTRCDVAPLGIASADAAMLRQIFENLLGNAFKYSAKNPAPTIRVDSVKENDLTWYRIVDNGVGFDMRYADRLFGMFQRMHAADDFPGTGVGLAIVKRLVERHGGQIEAEAMLGKGASFRFHLGNDQDAPA